MIGLWIRRPSFGPTIILGLLLFQVLATGDSESAPADINKSANVIAKLSQLFKESLKIVPIILMLVATWTEPVIRFFSPLIFGQPLRGS
jgi:hypothetical protein